MQLRESDARPKELDVVVSAVSMEGEGLEKVLSFLADKSDI